MDLQELSKANLVLFRPLHFCAAAFGLYWVVANFGVVANLALSGCVVPVWHTVLSLLLLCGRCENGVNYTLMSNAGCVAAAQNIQWTIV